MDLFPKEYKQKEGISGPSFNGSKFASFKKKPINFSNFSDLKAPFLRISLVASIFLLVIILLLWGGLIFYKKTLNNKISDTKEQQSKVFSQEDRELANKIIYLDKSAALVQKLLKSHVYTSEIFSTLASTTISQVQWRSLSISIKEKTISAKGLAANYSILAKQILALEEGFLGVRISDILLDKLGGVSFTANFGFEPKLIQKQ